MLKALLRPLKAVEFSKPVWSLLNRDARKQYEKNKPSLTATQTRIVSDLETRGFAVTHINDLFPREPEIYKKILEALPDLEARAVPDPKKEHFMNMWNSRTFALDPKSGFTQFALSPTVLNITNSYMKMWTRFLLANGYKSKITPTEDRVNTQNWHRDLHDLRLVMVFVYLTDVNDIGDGPLWYIEGSHKNKEWAKKFPMPIPLSKIYSDFSEDSLRRSIPVEKQKMLLGKKGTVVFADTRGLHRGGHCTKNARTIFVTGYTSDHRFSHFRRFSYPQDMSNFAQSLNPEGRYAVHLEKESATPRR